MYGVAPNSTRSPANSTFSFGSQTIVSPLVWPRPGCRICTSQLPIHSVMRLSNTMCGQVRPGIDSTAAEQPGEPADLALHVLLAALDDQVVRVVGWR